VNRHEGFTLVELMLALALGGLLLAGFVSLHGQAGAIARQVQVTADLQDTVRLALAYLETDLLQAGFRGRGPRQGPVAGAAGPDDPVVVDIGGDCGPNFSLNLDQPVAGRNGVFDLACGPYGGSSVDGSDVLIVRRAGGQPSGRDPGRLQLAAALTGAQLLAPADTIAVGSGAGDPVEIRDLVVSVYYVSRHSSGDPGRPSLRRKLLGTGPRLRDEEIAPGIRDLQLLFGLDLDPPGSPGAGSAEMFVHPDDPRLTPGTPVVAVRVWLLAESGRGDARESRPLPAYADRAEGGREAGRRLLISRTYSLANPAMRL
jgi:type IV pilus assembly protein PilW